MPCQLRPIEWRTWTGSNHVDRRPHAKPPVVADPEEFGLAVCAWWNSIKPTDCGTDGFSRIRKAGPHGLVSLAMVMLWWGRAARAGPHAFQGDSYPLWVTVVQEIGTFLRAMLDHSEASSSSSSPISTPSTSSDTNLPETLSAGRKRKEAEGTDLALPSKR